MFFSIEASQCKFELEIQGKRESNIEWKAEKENVSERKRWNE